MPTKSTYNVNMNAVDILNAIRNNATADYRGYVPAATADLDSIREIGAIIMDYQPLQNEFLTALINRIGRVILSNKNYTNPLNMFKKGLVEYGESIEDIFVNIAKVAPYDIEVAETELYKREIPDVRAAFYILNYQKMYKATIEQYQLRQAFLSWDGISQLITKVVESMYAGANYDEFLTTKYMLAKNILNGRLKAIEIPQVTAANAKTIATKIKQASNAFEFPSTVYNNAAVMNYSVKDSQYLIINSDYDAIQDIEVLASAFNMNKAEFLGHRVLIDSFGELDTNRLNALFADNADYTPLTDAEITALKSIPAVLVDVEYFQIYDNQLLFTNRFNEQGLYWNYFYHTWKIFAVSPFANATVFVPTTPSITSVTVSPEEATVMPDSSIQLKAEVVTVGFAPKTVVWSVPEGAKASVNHLGVVYIDDDATAGSTIVVTATSTFDSTKSDTCTITVGGE